MNRWTSALGVATALMACSSRAASDPQPAVTHDPASGVWSVQLHAMHAEVPLGDGKLAHGWTYDGLVPGPLIVVPEGASIDVTMRNDDPMTDMKHGLDIHAAQIAPLAFGPVASGQLISFRFVATVPGIFMYHCSAEPMLQHVANGMFGAFVVMPKSAPTARGYVIVQSEWYSDENDLADMTAGRASEVTFNGTVGALVRHPLLARTGELVRFFVLNAGPTHEMSLHVVGALLHPSDTNAGSLVQTLAIPPGSGSIVEVRFAQAGRYPIISHSLGDMALGAVGYIDVSDDADAATDSAPQLVR
jgi:nitrite reductase (NO-forming)